MMSGESMEPMEEVGWLRTANKKFCRLNKWPE